MMLIMMYFFGGSGNIGDDGLALMEAVHGTAPDIAGKVGFFSFSAVLAFRFVCELWREVAKITAVLP